ncbi:hypothetical protein F2Q68_00044658 [Brassica cretica]|uniref:Uncharacterized protein n=2 Tax=Brassica cretica TaxID=69181 RepID=A0ABQ7B0Q6_BRACR|nr:hypothetical protein F2Q68_00044658 [Brassica cretica]KAF3519868.1 hypothetical protein DY000_02060982 [Brassica cretica]
MVGGGRRILRDRPTYGTTFLGVQDDPSGPSSSGTVPAPEFVHESQSQRRSPQENQQSMPLPASYVPPAPYVPPPQHLQHPSQPHPPPPDASPAPDAAPAPA